MSMKRTIIGLMSLAVIGICAQPSWAWLFHHCCGCRYSTYICCQPYNAFTPVCFGNITGLGCCPIAMNCCQQSAPPVFAGPNFCDSCDNGSCFDGPSYPAPGPGPGNFTPPPPTPVNGPVSYRWNQPAPYTMAQPYNIQQASYYRG